MPKNLAHSRHAPPSPTRRGWARDGLGAQFSLSHRGQAPQGAGAQALAALARTPIGWGLAHSAGPETAVLAMPSLAAHHTAATPHFHRLRLAALRQLAEEHLAAHGGLLRPLASPPQALIIRTARDHAEALDNRLRLLLGEDAIASFDLPERTEALSERLAAECSEREPGFAVSLAAPRHRLLRLAPALTRDTLEKALAELDAWPLFPPPLLTLPLAALRDDAFLRFAARHRRRAGPRGEGLVAAVPLADLFAAPDVARRAAAALAHAGHRLAAALQPQALRLFDPTTVPASLLVTPWDPAWQRDDPALVRAGAERVLAMGVDSAAAISTCRAAGVGTVAGRAAARLLAMRQADAAPLAR